MRRARSKLCRSPASASLLALAALLSLWLATAAVGQGLLPPAVNGTTDRPTRDASGSIKLPSIELIAAGAIQGSCRDRSGLSELVGGTPHDLLGSFGSGIDSLGRDDLYLACDDRGPQDGAVRWRCRVQVLRLKLNPRRESVAVTSAHACNANVERHALPYQLDIELIATTLLSDELGQPLVGLAAECISADHRSHARFDPEGIRANRDGTFWISDEYGPWIDLFGPDGVRRRRIEIPPAYRIARAAATPSSELPPFNTSGRQSNRGFEGLAMSRDGRTLWAMPQSPLIQDGALDEKSGERAGVNIRVLELDLSSNATRQLMYQLDTPKLGVSEVMALDDGTLAVLERDGKAGEKATTRRLYRADPRAASDVSTHAALGARSLPTGTIAMQKSLYLDFMDPAHGLAGPTMPEKIEGLCHGPTLADGRATLIITSDNDLVESQSTWIWVFALPRHTRETADNPR